MQVGRAERDRLKRASGENERLRSVAPMYRALVIKYVREAGEVLERIGEVASARIPDMVRESLLDGVGPVLFLSEQEARMVVLSCGFRDVHLPVIRGVQLLGAWAFAYRRRSLAATCFVGVIPLAMARLGKLGG